MPPSLTSEIAVMSMPLGSFVAMTCTITLRVVTLTGSTCRVR